MKQNDFDAATEVINSHLRKHSIENPLVDVMFFSTIIKAYSKIGRVQAAFD